MDCIYIYIGDVNIPVSEKGAINNTNEKARISDSCMCTVETLQTGGK